ncbi:MAG: FAD-binding oxidoreductase, partial [Actinobacteria bacterium]|nr:FAD-binding oxidoreductase [Actinomycetota bacterium]
GPRQAVGPDITQIFVGSEGTLGLITEVTVRITPKPAHEARRAFSFNSFSEGLDACRRILRRGATPAVLRLYDEIESERNFSISRCALIVLDEADSVILDATMAIVDHECTQATIEDVAMVERWMGHRNDVSALEPLWKAGVVVDTIEVAGSWSSLDQLCEAVLGSLRAIEGTVLASVHESHAYGDGACLYFTFAGRPETDTMEAREAYYLEAWAGAQHAAIAAGASLSHHHGVGIHRARFVDEALDGGLQVLEKLKQALDPQNLLNPGKLGLPGSTWP